MRTSRIAAAVFALLGGGGLAAEVTVHSTTLVGGRPDVVDGKVKTVAPLYELVGLRAKNLELAGIEGLGIVVDAWGGLILPGSDEGIGASDVNLAFIEGRFFKKRLGLRLGRQFVVGGAARAMYFDGLSATYRSNAGIGLSAFAGLPVERRFSNLLRGDFVAGGRVFYGPSTKMEVGVSIVEALRRGSVARQDAGIDARWNPIRSLSLSGALIWSIADARLAELDIGPRFQPTDKIELLVSYRRTAPELFLPRTSIFTVFADTSRDDVGAAVSWQLLRTLNLFADLRMLWLNDEQGYDGSVRLSWRPFRAPTTVLTAQFHRLKIASNGYTQGRIGGRHVLPMGFGLAVDLETYELDQPIRGQTFSFSSAVTGTYSLGKSWLAGLTFFGATTPTFEHRYEVIGKLTYFFPGEAAHR